MEPGDSFVILKNSVSLDCLTTGSPKPTIEWKKAIGIMSPEQWSLSFNFVFMSLEQGYRLVCQLQFLLEKKISIGYSFSFLALLLCKIHVVYNGNDIWFNAWNITSYMYHLWFWNEEVCFSLVLSLLGKSPGLYQRIRYIANDDATTASKQLLSNGTLIIRNAKEEDHGYYLCHSKNSVGPGISKVIFLRVHSMYLHVYIKNNYLIKFFNEANHPRTVYSAFFFIIS